MKPNAAGTAAIDGVLLGIGEDGHVASLFPLAPEEAVRSSRPDLPVPGPTPPLRRIMLTCKALAAAREVRMLAAGGVKAAALGQSLRAAGSTPPAKPLQSRQMSSILASARDGARGRDIFFERPEERERRKKWLD